MVMIGLAVGAVAKWWGSSRSDADADVQGDDPIVRALFKAVNLGEADDFLALVHDECKIYVNSYELARNDNQLDHGPDLWKDAFEDLHEHTPDVHWELYDELSGKDEGEQKIVIRFVSASTVDGQDEDFEVAGFGIVEDKKLKEWRQVADLDIYNRRRAGTGEDAVGGSSDSSS